MNGWKLKLGKISIEYKKVQETKINKIKISFIKLTTAKNSYTIKRRTDLTITKTITNTMMKSFSIKKAS
jgi:hypothetical protein